MTTGMPKQHTADADTPPVLQDAFGRRFHYLRLSVTDVCNFRCNYCLPDGYRKTMQELPLTVPEIETLVHAFAALGTRKVRLTGGEPATRRDLTRLIEVCKSTPGIDRVALTTNGYNLKYKAAEWKNAGLDAINVSVDSLDATEFHRITGHNILARVMAGIDQALATGVEQVKVNAVLLRQFNQDQLQHFIHWVRDMPVSVRFIELMETGNNGVFFRENRITGESIRTLLQEQGWQLKARDRLSGPALEFTHPQYQGGIGLIMPYSKDFCRTCNRLRVSSQGHLHLCLFAEEGISLRESLHKRDVIGTIRTIRRSLNSKTKGHRLHEGFTGSTSHLAMLGG